MRKRNVKRHLTMKAIVLLFLTALPMFHCADPEVTTKYGTIRGQTNTYQRKKADQYLGIPYAEPPIGELRFQKPRELTTKWNQTLVAKTMPVGCMQKRQMPMSEDCLYLNIWVPNKRPNNKLLPVLFWIHGGAFVDGAARDFDGGILSTYTETVVVIINYRLTNFGFVYGNSDDMPGNAGLYDQRLAMKWVSENIKGFGGDPNQVTIFGESAGSMSISVHLMSSGSWSYFARAQMTSGVAMDYVTCDQPDWAVKRVKQLARVVGCEADNASTPLSPSTKQCLRAVDAKKLVNASMDDSIFAAAPKLSASALLWFPVFGTDFIAKRPQEIWEQKEMKPNTSICIGNIFNEFPMAPFIPATVKPSDAMAVMISQITEKFASQQELHDFLKIHFIGVNETKDRDAGIQAATQLHANTNFQCVTNAFAAAYSYMIPVYQFLFTYKPKNDTPICGAKHPCHGSDLQMTFGSVKNRVDEKFSKEWMKMIGNFAKTGTTFWPPFYRTNSSHLVPVYYDFNGKSKPSNTNVGIRTYICLFWRYMLSK